MITKKYLGRYIKMKNSRTQKTIPNRTVKDGSFFYFPIISQLPSPLILAFALLFFLSSQPKAGFLNNSSLARKWTSRGQLPPTTDGSRSVSTDNHQTHTESGPRFSSALADGPCPIRFALPAPIWAPVTRRSTWVSCLALPKARWKLPGLPVRARWKRSRREG